MTDMELKASPVWPRALRGKAAANYVGICLKTLDNLVRRREITARYVGRARIFLVEELDRFLESRPTAQPVTHDGLESAAQQTRQVAA